MSEPSRFEAGGFDSSAPAPVPPGFRALQIRRAAGAPFLAGFHLWRRSLQLRTVSISVLMSAVALAAVGTYMSYAIGQGLFSDRLNQVLLESNRGMTAAQSTMNSATVTDPTALLNTQFQAIAQANSSATEAVGYAWDRPPANTSFALQDISSPSWVATIVSQELRTQVQQSTTGQHWQSVAIPSSTGRSRPGIVVGDALQVPKGGSYEFYLVYDVDDVQTTLDFVQRTLLLGGLVLVLLIGAVTLLVVRLVVVPIRQAAAVSEQLARGELERRIPQRGVDEVATLARSFNRMADGLQRQITQLANLSRVQQRFVSDVSHELRTPLTTIRLATDLLYDSRDRFDPHAARSAELLKTQVARFESLLADLLEISRMDAQAADLAGEPTNLVALVRESIDALGSLAADTGTEVRLVAPGGHVGVEVDARRIERIVRNLLANAIEHGEGRPVVVTVDSSATAVGLGVRDHGIGLEAADAPRVFDRFWRADPSRQRRIGGTGLGLAISQEDAGLHGGTLQVWSRPGDGANFVLTLPRVLGAPTGESPIALRPADANGPDAQVSSTGTSPRRRRLPRRGKARL